MFAGATIKHTRTAKHAAGNGWPFNETATATVTATNATISAAYWGVSFAATVRHITSASTIGKAASGPTTTAASTTGANSTTSVTTLVRSALPGIAHDSPTAGAT